MAFLWTEKLRLIYIMQQKMHLLCCGSESILMIICLAPKDRHRVSLAPQIQAFFSRE